MDSWVDNLHASAATLHDQIAAALQVQREQGVNLSSLIASYRKLLDEMYTDSMPLASLMDKSDLLFHAEGPGAQHHAAFSSAVAWLCEEVERRIRQLASASIGAGAAGEAAEGDLRVLLNGVAPGSLWAGFSVDSAQRMAATSSDLNPEGVTEVLNSIRGVVRGLPLVQRFIGDEKVSEEINDAIEDPQIRDASLMATFHLSPTGRRGIHTLEISAPRSNERVAMLTNRERTVLRETAVRQPMLRRTARGTFVGQLREVDLDARRFQLRGVPGIGTLRCVLNTLDDDIARRHIGMGAKVTGNYETDKDGRPRLMQVEEIVPFQIQLDLDQ